MTKVVVFTKNNARIIHGVDQSQFKGMDNAVIDPDLSAVKGIAPHHWKLVKGQILPMSAAEIKARDVHIYAHGADNRVGHIPLKAIHKHRPWVTPAIYASLLALGMALGAALHHFTGGF